jgi:glycosyltransferase involved in cell wall biosynthesis
MNVLALASYPIEAAATRYRLAQFVGPLNEQNIRLTIHPFIDSELFARLYARGGLPFKAGKLLQSTLARVVDLVSATRADVILVQREAIIFGPPLLEWFMARVVRRPLVLDLDDATYVPYTSPTYGRVTKALKFFGKTDYLIRWADVVICGNSAIADYVVEKGGRAQVIPTVVDTELFKPLDHRPDTEEPVLGWIGTHSTFPYLQSIFPVLSALAQRHKFRLKIIGAGKDNVAISGISIENLPWLLYREVADFQSLDVGLYPIDQSIYQGWASGKSGFKAIQYMAVGVPYVATPIGASGEIGEVGVTHFTATTHDEWYRALEELITKPEKRRAMGAAGRDHVTRHYALEDQAEKLGDVLRSVVARK